MIKMLFLILLTLAVACGKLYGILCGEQGSRGQIYLVDPPDTRGRWGQIDPYTNETGGVKKQGVRSPSKEGASDRPLILNPTPCARVKTKVRN